MTYEARKILIIETNTPCEDANKDFFARAIVFENDTDTDALSVTDIFESANIDVLRDMIKTQHADVTHYKPNSRNFDGSEYRTGDWSDALRCAKEKAYEGAMAEGADVRKNMSLRHLVEAHMKALARKLEIELDNLRRDEERAAAQQSRDERAEERKDFDAWTQMARAARDDDKKDYQLAVAMRWAYNEVESFPALLEAHVAKLTENPTYALGWSGDFVQSAADNDVAKYLVELFESGVSFDDMEDAIMREMFNKADRAVSRSTSVMSNLTDDCVRVAWTSAAKRITGKSFW